MFYGAIILQRDEPETQHLKGFLRILETKAGLPQTSNMGTLTIVTKLSILDVCGSPGNASKYLLVSFWKVIFSPGMNFKF